ncbi:YjiH family protein [Floccifex sp.]|uniref:YjiH family protein n=1 Tax=Floccifex sp. TaxID=2815810 RepID=UPI003F055647
MKETKITLKSTLKFALGTLLGLFLVVIPLNFADSVDTFTFYYLKKFVAFAGHYLEIAITCLVVLSAVLAVIDFFAKPKFIEDNKLMKKLFSCSCFDVINRVCGAIIAVIVCFNFPIEMITSIDTGGTMLPLSAQLSIIIPPMIFFQTFILEFGFMEFVGTLFGFIVKPLFKVSKMAAVSIISAWVGPGNAAIMGTRQLFDEGYYTLKEAAIIGTTFSTSSIGWVVLVANVLGIMDKFGWFFLTITLVGIIVAIIGIRIPPISHYQDLYVNGKETSDRVVEKETDGGICKQALTLACERVETVTVDNFKNKIQNMLTYILCLQPVIIFWGTAALVLSTYTPILEYLSYPIGLFMDVLGIQDAYVASSAILSGFADNYLPVILTKGLVDPQVKFIVGAMSILQIVFMSEIGALLTSTKLVQKFVDIIIIFLERTIISLPFVVLISFLIF